ncbi:unnamed protein product, partial [Closterium sp. Yama58-4]
TVDGRSRFVHPDVPHAIAERLGARSLRGLSLDGPSAATSLPCLPAVVISELLEGWAADAHLLLFDLLEVADACGARGVEFVWDQRHHPEISLLQPNLGQFQGPSLTILFHGAQLTSEDICHLHTPPPIRLRDATCRYGTGLLGAYHLSDLPLIVSGSFLYAFDPSGHHLFSGSAGGGAAVAGSGGSGGLSAARGSSGSPGGSRRRGGGDDMAAPVARAFSLKGSGSSSFINRFPDQFQPLIFAASSSSSSSHSSHSSHPSHSSASSASLWDETTVLRLPLRTQQQADFSPIRRGHVAGPWDIVLMAQLLQQHGAASLVFLNSVETVSFSVWPAAAAQPEEFFHVQ